MSLITRFMTAVTEPQFILARDLMALAVADGKVTEEEKTAISSICHIEGVDEADLMAHLCDKVTRDKAQIPQYRKEKEAYLKELIIMIGADEYCSPQEVYLFQIVASKMGLNQMDIVGLFMTTATHAYFNGDVGSKVLASFLKNYIDPIGRTEQQNMEGLRKMYETVANSIEPSNDIRSYMSLLHESLSKATQALLENQILHNGFQRIGIDFAKLLNRIESQISFAKLREFSK